MNTLCLFAPEIAFIRNIHVKTPKKKIPSPENRLQILKRELHLPITDSDLSIAVETCLINDKPYVLKFVS